jgi:LPS sulfotransferase NodH
MEKKEFDEQGWREWLRATGIEDIEGELEAIRTSNYGDPL